MTHIWSITNRYFLTIVILKYKIYLLKHLSDILAFLIVSICNMNFQYLIIDYIIYLYKYKHKKYMKYDF